MSETLLKALSDIESKAKLLSERKAELNKENRSIDEELESLLGVAEDIRKRLNRETPAKAHHEPIRLQGTIAEQCIRALRLIGKPARAREIFDYVQSHGGTIKTIDRIHSTLPSPSYTDVFEKLHDSEWGLKEWNSRPK